MYGMLRPGGSGIRQRLAVCCLNLAQSVLGPPVRRVRREAQWRAQGIDYRIVRRTDPFAFLAAAHMTPLIRNLAGLDERLQRNKIVNLQLAAGRLDGIVLLPDRRLSFWHEVGKPSSRRGYLDGMVLRRGRITAGIGGGLCQMTNLLYWMTLHTPLSVIERWRHSYDVFPDEQRTQPFGSGATCAWPALDLQIENPTTTPYRLSVHITNENLVGSWTAPEPLVQEYRIEERAHRIALEYPGIYMRYNELWRIEYDPATSRTCERLMAENQARMMYRPILPCVTPPPG